MQLSFDGSERNYYSLRTIAWSPDSKKLVAYHTRPGFDREIMYIESSPADQLQPKHMTVHYAKPGDPVDIAYPVLFDVASRKGIEIDNTLFPHPYDITPPVWWKDSRAFTFEYNQRGHQAYKVIEVDANTGSSRALIDEETKTFFYYSNLGPGMSAGRKFRYDVNDGKEIIWASERDGWEHLYLYDGTTGKVKNQITKGDWLVRDVAWVDEANRQIWFAAGGSIPGQDPYFTQYYRINFDGSGLTHLTDADGMHNIVFSKDHKFYVDTWQRVDLAPVAQLRRSDDQKVVLDLDKGDTTALLAAGFRPPEVFVAKGRDGKTDIWGTITKPLNFDSEEEVSGRRKHLCRAAGIVRPQDLQRARSRTRLWPSWDSSWCTSTAWARATARRHSTMSRGRILVMQDFRIASCGIRPLQRSIPGTTSRVWESSAHRRADRTPWAPCCSILSSTRSR